MTKKLTDEYLRRIKERVDAASVGWVVTDETYVVTLKDAGETQVVAECQSEEDAYFISEARQDVPALLAEVGRLRNENELLESFFAESERNKNRYADEMLVFRKYAEKFADVLAETYVGLEFPEYQEFRKLMDGDADA